MTVMRQDEWAAGDDGTGPKAEKDWQPHTEHRVTTADTAWPPEEHPPTEHPPEEHPPEEHPPEGEQRSGQAKVPQQGSEGAWHEQGHDQEHKEEWTQAEIEEWLRAQWQIPEGVSPEVAGVLADLQHEWRQWDLKPTEWPPLEELPPLVCERIARRRYTDEVAADDRSFRGFDMRVDIYNPDKPGERGPVPFVIALQVGWSMCMEAFQQVEDAPDVLRRLSNCVYCLFAFSASFMQQRFLPSAAAGFDKMLDAVLRPGSGVVSLVRNWNSAPPDERPQRIPFLAHTLGSTMDTFLRDVRLVRTAHHVTDAAVSVGLDELIDTLDHKMRNPSEEDLVLLHLRPPIEFRRRWDVAAATRIMLEIRAAFAQPKFQAMWAIWQDAQKGNRRELEELQGLKAGQHGLFAKHHKIFAKHNIDGAQDFVRLTLEWAQSDPTIRKITLSDMATLTSGFVPPNVPAARVSFAPGSRVWAFYDTYDQKRFWKYRYVHLDEPPSGFPLVGISAGWLTGTIVSGPESSDDALGGFLQYVVRFDGVFSDARELDPHLRGHVSLQGDLMFQYGRRCSKDKKFKVPATLVRDIADEPPRPVLSTLLVRPKDYCVMDKGSDYNICADGYVDDLCHGPCSMHEQLPGEYEIVTAFTRETEDLERLDAQHLRSRLRGKNVIGWYLQWPQIASKSLWGSGSVRKPVFFGFCTRMERAGVVTGWPHASHVYELLAGKLWIPRMSLCKDFKVPPTVCMDYANFKSNPRRAALRALEHLNHVRSSLWAAPSISSESYKGVVKFGYSWCGTDVVPFLGVENLIKAAEGMFHKEGVEHTTILVQDMLPNVVAECRNLCLYDACSGTYHKERLWVGQMQKFSASVEGFSGMASSNVLTGKHVVQHCMRGDAQAAANAEAEVDLLCDRWLRWARAESPIPLQCTRIDFLVAKGEGPGEVSVWTCEVGECGGSLCSVEVHGRNTVALNNAIREDASGRFPAPLPRPLPRNNGIKSH